MNLSYACYVFATSDATNETNVYLLDTGANISVLKIGNLLNSVLIDDNSCKISGIADGLITTHGTVDTNVIIENWSFQHTFHIVDDDFPIPCDGILGFDFVKKYRCLLDYSDCWRMTIRPKGYKPISTMLYESPDNDSLTLPPRCEVIRRIGISPGRDDVYIPSQQIADGVFVGRTIVSRVNPYVRVLNINDEPLVLHNVTVTSEHISNFNIYDPPVQDLNYRPEIMEKLQKNFPSFVHNGLTKLCSKYDDVFALETDKVTFNNFYKQKLYLNDTTPVYIKNYRIPKVHKEIINKKVDIFLDNGIVSPSISDYNSPILLVPKKKIPGSDEKRYRFVVDYRHLNKNLIADKFPLPRMDDLLDQLGNAKFFSVVDLLNGFHQIELDEESKNLTSFSTDKGSFKFNSLPFGLKVGPNSFQRMMSIAFSGLKPLNAFIYMDDLVVTATTQAKMFQNLEEVFKICRQYNLKLHPDKCRFFLKEVTFLGHKCTQDGILPDPAKIDKVLNYPRPVDSDSARRFVAFCNYYRRFIPKFTHHALYITALLRKDVPFYWSQDCEDAFQYLKNSLINPPILRYPDFDKEFCITTDASGTACGAVLTQKYGGLDMPIAYASRPFTQGERNKSTPEQELCAIHWALNHFRPYVYGLKFLVKTDHRPLIYMYNMKNPNSKLLRMRLDIEEYDFDIEYIPGKDNVTADALSRIDFKDIKDVAEKINAIFMVVTRSKTRKLNNDLLKQPDVDKQSGEKDERTNDDVKIYEALNTKEVKLVPKLIFNLRARDPYCVVVFKKQTLINLALSKYRKNGSFDVTQILQAVECMAKNNDITNVQMSQDDDLFALCNVKCFKILANKVLKNLRIALTPSVTYLTDKDLISNLLQKYHDDPMHGGHAGVKRLYKKLKQRYHWPKMLNDVLNYVKNCKACQLNKTKSGTKEKLSITPTPQSAFDIVLVDTIGPLPKSYRGNVYAVTLMCDLTKFLVTIPLPDKKAVQIAKAIFENFILIYGPMKQLLSDRGSEYVNSILNDLCKLLNVNNVTSTSYHHRTLGTVERSHRTFNEYLRSYINDYKSDWDDWLAYFTYCYNTTPSVAISDYSPYQLIFGKTPVIYDCLKSDTVDPVYNVDDYHREVKFRLQVANKLARECLNKAKLKRKISYDVNANPNEKLSPGDLVLVRKQNRHKLDPLFKGPFTVKEVLNPNVCIKDEIGKEDLVHKDNVKSFDKCFYFRLIKMI